MKLVVWKNYLWAQILYISLVPSKKTASLISDDEKNLHDCFKSAIAKKNIPVSNQLCSWHFARNSIARLTKLGLASAVRRTCTDYDGTFAQQFWIIRNLFLLPPAAILPSVRYIRERSDSKFEKYFTYLESKLAKDQYAEQLSWSAYLSSSIGYLTDNMDTTSSRSEGLHRRYEYIYRLVNIY